MLRRSAIICIRVVAAIVAAFGIYYFCVVPYRGNLLLVGVGLRTANAEKANPIRTINLAHENLRDLDVAKRGCRLDPNWYLLYGTNCELLGRWTEAADTYTRALRIDDRPEIYVNRGMVMLHLGRVSEAEADLTRAARFDPTVINDLDGDLRARVVAAAGIH
jgi:tetratricopeptide (TPR) repeat protein